MDDLYRLIRQAYPYAELGLRAYTSVLEMLSGRYPSLAHGELRPRLVWDKVNQQLAALPGARLMAMTSGGTIPDRGAFGAYLSDGKTKLGELDEEFVYETRTGDTFTLGSQVWRVLEMTDDKVIVGDAAGSVPRMPFWRGDYPWRPYELGQRVGAFRRAVAERLQAAAAALGLEDLRATAAKRESPPLQELLAWLRQEYALDENSAGIVVDYVAGQVDHAGGISSDRTVLVEVFDDAVGDPRLVIQSPFGGRVNGLWGIALASALRERTGVDVEVQSNDDGILFRFPAADADFPLDLVTGMTPGEARERILGELPNSAVFGAQFRQNAARALLLPGLGRGKRTPFWLQRLRAKDLLQVVRRFEDFPIVAETYRDCLQEVMDLPHLEIVLEAIQRGEIEVIAIESLTPSPVAQSLLWDFISIYMYEWDAPKAERQLQTLAANRDLLQELLQDVDLSDLLRPEAVTEVRGRLQHTAPAVQVRTMEELAYLFQSVGDLSSVEVAERCTLDPAGWIGRLAGDGRIVSLPIPTANGVDSRWVAAELASEYIAAFDLDFISADSGQQPCELSKDEARRRILHLYLSQAGPATVESIRLRYDFPVDWLVNELAALVANRQLAQGRFTPIGPAAAGEPEYVDRRILEQMHRRTPTILRNEVQPVSFAAYADFLVKWQHIHPSQRLAGESGLRRVLQQLRVAPVAGRAWERDVLPLRLETYQPSALAELCQSGEVMWVGSGGVDPRRLRIRYLFRGEGSAYLEPAPEDLSTLSEHAQAVHAFLRDEGAVFPADLRAALDLTEQEAAAALWELAAAGIVTNDSLAPLRELLQFGSQWASHVPKALSPLEAELAERLSQQRAQRDSTAGWPALRPTFGGSVSRPGRSEVAAARRRVAERMGRPLEPVLAPKQEGRWALVHRFGVMGKPLPQAEVAARQTRQLLARHGVVTHASLDGEIGAWDWGTIYPELQRLEMRGEVRRGYFIRGLPGVQFALPEAVEQLRAVTPRAMVEDEPIVLLNACDPANLYGPAGESRTATGEPFAFSRIPSTWLALQSGRPILLIGDTGADLTTAAEADDGQIRRALAAWVAHAGTFELRLHVSSWNAQPVLGSAGQSLLEAVGFYRDYQAMAWEHSRQ